MPDRDLVGFVYNPRLPRAADLVASLVHSLGLEGSSWVASAAELDVAGEKLADTSVIVTAGGDGTILRAVRVAVPFSVPILGINLGRVGFMTELTADEAADKIPAYLDGTPRVEERMMLLASVGTPSSTGPAVDVHALNDVVVSRGAVARILDIDVAVDGAPLATYRADGVIVSTATGSTGYALAAGGPILYPEARVMLVQPLAAHMSLQTGLVVPGDSVLELAAGDEQEAVLSADGISDTTLGPGSRAVIRSSPYVARFLRADPPAAFYSDLTRRLGVKARPQASSTSE